MMHLTHRHMVTMHVCWALPLFLAIGGQPVAGSNCTTSRYITADNCKVAEDADKAVTAYCTGGFAGDVEKEDARKSLENGVGGNNIIYQSVKEASDIGDVPELIWQNADVMWLFF